VGMFERSTFTFPIVAKSKPPPFEDHKGWGTHPKKPNRSLAVDVLEWYNSTAFIFRWKNRKRLGHLRN
jgi:hypothetical protein